MMPLRKPPGGAIAALVLWAVAALAAPPIVRAAVAPSATSAAGAEKPRTSESKAARPEEIAESLKKADAALAAPESKPPEAGRRVSLVVDIPEMNLWELTVQGGPLMIPIGLFSVLVVALAFERAIALRRRNILPRALVRELRELGAEEHGLDPRHAYKLCQKHPSSAAQVIRAMLLKVGRPHAEIREAVAEASQREADRLSGPARWLTLSAAVAPMLGLLGTVQGMIQAFFITAHLPVGVNKAQFLAEAIYVALVTTFGGLTVAIPAAILAHLFHGKILRLFREMDEVLLVLETQIQRFQRRRRLAKDGAADGAKPERSPPASPEEIHSPQPHLKRG